MTAKKQTASQPTQVVFEGGYERLKEIGARLDAGDVTVAEMCDLYAEGKGLGRALMEYLDEREGELKEIDEGRNLPRFRVVAPSDPAAEEPAALPHLEASGSNGGGEDQIPF
jgi:exodeoxyribonuclease VII small subunit